MLSLSHLRRMFLLVAVSLLPLLATSPSQATTLDFNSQPEVYFVSPIHEAGFTFASLADGFGTNNNTGFWPSNGTVHLMSWTNTSSISGFTLTADNGSLFTLNSFSFGGGYLGQHQGVDSLTVTSAGGGTPFTQTFVNGVDYNNYGPGLTLLSLLGDHAASSFTFTAFGTDNRAIFDDIVINEAPSTVPEPSTVFLLAAGLAGLGLLRRRQK